MRILTVNNQNNQNNPNFKARLEVRISKKFMKELRKEIYAGDHIQRYIEGIEFLRTHAQKIGSEKDVFILKSQPNSNKLLLMFKKSRKLKAKHEVISNYEICKAFISIASDYFTDSCLSTIRETPRSNPFAVSELIKELNGLNTKAQKI